MSRVGLAHVPDDLVAAIVRRALSDSGSTLQARLDLSLVSKAWQAALTGCKVTHEFRGRLSAAQLAWIGSTKTRLAGLSFAAVGGCGTGADPHSAQLLLDPEALSASARSLAAVRNMVVPLNASAFAALRHLDERFCALRTVGIIIDTPPNMAPGNAAVPMADVRLPEILRAVPAAVEVLEITLLVDMFVAVEGTWLGHVHALRRLHLSGPCLEALFCDVEGLPADLEELSISLPRGEVSVVLDDASNCFSQPLQGCGDARDLIGNTSDSATSLLWRVSADGQRRSLRLTIADARHCTGRRTLGEEEEEQELFTALEASLAPGRECGFSGGASSGGLPE